MASFNKVILAGNLTRDPELKSFANGTTVTKLGLAINRTYIDKNGERREEVLFVDVDAFGKQAETISRYFSKGRPILVEGRLKLDTWDDKNTGEKRSKLGVVLETFSFLDGKSSAGDAGAGAAASPAGNNYAAAPAPRAAAGSARPAPASAPRSSAPPPPPPPPNDGVEEDVPF
ncbi:MAG: single-stranded DNA-binding protein [Puniceicoccales bacterium]|nr:single-stranded DNA-binding protein [Puniceicoccales bacterium]